MANDKIASVPLQKHEVKNPGTSVPLQKHEVKNPGTSVPLQKRKVKVLELPYPYRSMK